MNGTMFRTGNVILQQNDDQQTIESNTGASDAFQTQDLVRGGWDSDETPLHYFFMAREEFGIPDNPAD